MATAVTLASCTEPHNPEQVTSHPATYDIGAVDADFPPAIQYVSFNSGGSKLNGLVYIANGPGPHPTVVLLHGYPGNEKNLDLAQAMRRAGNNVLYFDYRGTWGSGGEFSIAHALEDVAEALRLTRDSKWAGAHRSDPKRVAMVGHSFGGFLGAITTAEDSAVPCFAFLAGADMGAMGFVARGNEQVAALIEATIGADMDADGGPVNGDARRFIVELIEQAEAYELSSRAPALATRPLLLVAGERDKVLPKSDHHDRLLAALHAEGAARLTELVFDDDHAFSANRIALARQLVDWQEAECWR